MRSPPTANDPSRGLYGGATLNVRIYDLDHNPTSLETATGVCVAALGIGVTPIARVTSHDPHDATRILDCGAQGVMAHMFRTPPKPGRSSRLVSVRPRGIAHRSALGSGPLLVYAARNPSRSKPATFAGLPQRIYIPLQPAVLSVKLIPLAVRLGISGRSVAPTHEGLYSGSWKHPKCSRSSVA
jgi:hypothetical protein